MSDTNNEITEPLINNIVPELVEGANVDYTSAVTLPKVGKVVVKDADARGKLAEVITSTNKAIEEVIKLHGTAEQLYAQDKVLANAAVDLRDGQVALAEAVNAILDNQDTLADKQYVDSEIQEVKDTFANKQYVDNGIQEVKDSIETKLTTADLVITNDAKISGNLTVSGEIHAVKVEDVSSIGDYVVLRANNDASIGFGKYSGIVINKYNGTNDLAIVTDNTGTAMIGTGVSTESSYANIYLSKSNHNWYSDSGLTTEVSPSGVLSSWDSVDDTNEYTHYVNAVFSEINVSSTQAIATRDETSQWDQNEIAMYDKANEKLTGIGIPSQNNTVLTAQIDNQTGSLSYAWKSGETAVDVVEDGNMKSVTSNAVAAAIANAFKISPVENFMLTTTDQTVPYDGIIYIEPDINGILEVFINGYLLYWQNSSEDFVAVQVCKGDTIRISDKGTIGRSRARWYKNR